MVNHKFGAINGRGDAYDIYIGRYVEIITQNATYCGKYNGINDNDDIVLNPFLRKEYHPTNKDNEGREALFSLVDEPQFIHRNIMGSLSPINESYVSGMVARKEIILPSRK
ncbi:MAG: hypothetical protein AABX83_02260 [Nanoarchaeota archaeon]